MNRRDFIKISSTGLLTLFLSGCGLNALNDNQTIDTANAQNSQGDDKMKIVVITGSPHKAGTSALLADKFIEGATDAGHKVFRFNSAFEDIHSCLACNHCQMDGPCIQNDAIEQKLMSELINADLIVLITPLYYYDMSAQIKTVIDRFHSRSDKLHHKKSILMATAYNNADWTMEALVDHYETISRFMEWQDIGKVLAIGCGSRSLIEKSDFPNQAYQIGLNL